MFFEVQEIEFNIIPNKDEAKFKNLFYRQIQKYASNTTGMVMAKKGNVNIKLDKPISPNTLNNVLSKIQNNSEYQIARVDYMCMLDTVKVEIR